MGKKSSFDVATEIEEAKARADSLCWFIGSLLEQVGRGASPELEHAALLVIDLAERLQAVTDSAYQVARGE